MKKVRIGDFNYRAKHAGKRNGKDIYEYQFQPLMFGRIPMPWESFYGIYSLEWIKKDVKEKSLAKGTIAKLD